MNSAGIRSIAVGFPKTVRDNQWFIDHHPDVALRAVEHDIGAASGPCGRVEAGHQALGTRFLISSGAVDLAGQKQP